MIKHISRATRLFIGLVIITLLVTYVALVLSYRQEISMLAFQADFNTQAQAKNPAHTILSTTDWKEYDDAEHNISFLYPEDWKVTTKTNIENFYSIILTSPKSDASAYIYISKSGYLGIDGANKKPYAIDSAPGIIVDETLFGVKAGEYYYTFDNTFASGIDDEFYTLAHTVKFN